MSTEFLRLYRELAQITPSTVFDEKKLTAQRNDVMHRLGYKQTGGEMKYTKCAKYHGKKAREDAHDARQAALQNDAKAKAQKRMMVHNAVHEVEHLNSLARELSTFVDKKEPVPGLLMRKLLGNDAMRLKAPQTADERPLDQWKQPTIPRQPREKRKDFTLNSWSLEERKLLNKIYLEMPKPTVMTKLDSWRIFYENVCSRFIQFYPQRTLKESIAKLEEMIHRRAIKEVGEPEYWEQVQARFSPTKGSADSTSLVTSKTRSEDFSAIASRQSRHSQLKLGGSIAVGSSLTKV